MTYLLATHIPTRRTFVAELARRGCRKIVYSVMPADRPGGDVRTLPRQVPLDIRRAAKRVLLAEPAKARPLPGATGYGRLPGKIWRRLPS